MVIHTQSAFGSAAFTGLINSIWHFNCSWFGYSKVFNSNSLHFFIFCLLPLQKMNRDWIFYFCLFTIYLVNQSRLLEWNVKRIAWFSNLFLDTKSTLGFLIRGVNTCKQKVDIWHTGPVLKSLHLVPVPFVIDFKILLAWALIALLVINPLFIHVQPEGLWMESAGCPWVEAEDGGVTVLPELLDSGTTCQRSTGLLNQYHRLNHFLKHSFIERLFFKFKFRKSLLILYCFNSFHTV